MGQVQPDRTTRYNSKYWKAATADINGQMKKLRFPNRPSNMKPLNLKPQGSQPIETGPYTRGNKGRFAGPTKFGPKNVLPK